MEYVSDFSFIFRCHLIGNIRISINDEAKSLQVLVKGGGWGRYSVTHLLLCTRHVKRLNDKFTSVTDKLVTFNEKVFVRWQLLIDCEVWCVDYIAGFPV